MDPLIPASIADLQARKARGLRFNLLMLSILSDIEILAHGRTDEPIFLAMAEMFCL